jgi:hypothetical protein
MITRRSIDQYLKTPAIIRTPGLLMRVKVHREETAVGPTPQEVAIYDAIQRYDLCRDQVIELLVSIAAMEMTGYSVGVKPGPDGEQMSLFSASRPEFGTLEGSILWDNPTPPTYKWCLSWAYAGVLP